ncbi:MAG TPA: tetratricopeptide repeat protein [Bacillales bacterium]
MKIEDQRELLGRWYGAIKNQDREEVSNWRKRFESRSDMFADPELQKFYELLSARYYLLDRDFAKADSALEMTGPVKEDKWHWLNYYYYFFKGISLYDQGQYQAAIENYMKAKPIVTDISLEEMGEFYFELACVYHRNYEITLSVKYADKALEIFKRKSNFRRIITCENVLGINNKDFGQYKEAERHYHEALLHLQKYNDSYLKMLVLNNFGSMCSEQNDPKAAINFLRKASPLIEPWDNGMKSRNIYLLAKNYFKTGQIQDAHLKLDFGLKMSEQVGNYEYLYRFNLLKAKFVEPEHFEYVYKEGISFFHDHKWWDYVATYSLELANYYRKSGLHQNSNDYYHMAEMARNNFKKERAHQ